MEQNKDNNLQCLALSLDHLRVKSFNVDLKQSPVNLNWEIPHFKSVIADKTSRGKGARQKAKFDGIKWDGMSASFRLFIRALEGHLLKVGTEYIQSPNLV